MNIYLALSLLCSFCIYYQFHIKLAYSSTISIQGVFFTVNILFVVRKKNREARYELLKMK